MNFTALIKAIIMLAVLSIVAFYFYQHYKVNEPKQMFSASGVASMAGESMARENMDNIDDIAPTYNESIPATELETTPQNQQSFVCDGRQHCSQMTSCEEATFFNNNCPSAKMDGNNDGVACEQQWCH